MKHLESQACQTQAIPQLQPQTPTASGDIPEMTEQSCALDDGSALFYRAWTPRRATPRAVILLHRGHEHSGRIADVVETLDVGDEAAVFAWDARGHGRSEGARGDAPSFSTLVRDLECFVRHLEQAHGVVREEIVVVAHSVGAVIAATWLHDFAPRIRGLVLVTPAFEVRLYLPFAAPLLGLWQRVKGARPAFVQSYVKARMLTHDREQARRYEADPMITRAIAVPVLLGMRKAAARVTADAAVCQTPTLLLTGGADWVVSVKAQRRYFDELGAEDKSMRVFPGLFHDLLHERGREPVLAEIRGFVARRLVAPRVDTGGPVEPSAATLREYATLSAPPRSIASRLWFGLQRSALRTVGRLSHGIRVGLRCGFDAGEMLDVVYENDPRGALGVGKLIDRGYLESVGWRGIRSRREQIVAALTAVIREAAETGDAPVQLLDVATGAGRYVLDTLEAVPDIEVAAVLRDNVERNLDVGRELTWKRGVSGVTFERGDAFDGAALAKVDPAPDVVIVAGLYELFADNEKVADSLAGIAAALRRRAVATGRPGYLIYTGQPWHPQLETIARVLPNREGQPWVMRRRPQAEIDGLVAAAGLEKCAQAIDDDGIFTVSTARVLPC